MSEQTIQGTKEQRRAYGGKPHYIVRCSCGNGMALEMDYGKTAYYRGYASSVVLANVFDAFHKPHGLVVREIYDPR